MLIAEELKLELAAEKARQRVREWLNSSGGREKTGSMIGSGSTSHTTGDRYPAGHAKSAAREGDRVPTEINTHQNIAHMLGILYAAHHSEGSGTPTDLLIKYVM